MRGRVWMDKRTRGKPAWCIVWQDLEGRVHRQRTEAVNKAQAQALLHAKQSDLVAAKVTGKPLEELKAVPFSEFIKGFMERGGSTYTPATLQSYKSLRKTSERFFGARPMRSISRQLVREFYESFDKAKPATANRYLSFVSAVFREALDRSLVDFNPVRGIKKRREDNFKLRFLSEVEEKRLEPFLPYWLRPIVTFAIHTGMRKGEVIRLAWADVDFGAGRISVRVAKNHRERHVPMDETVRALLEELCPKSETWEGAGNVFGDKDGEAWSPSGVAHAFRKAAGSARIAGVSFHTLRHTTASRMVQRRVSLKAVQEILGHSSMNVTLRYAHLAQGDLDDAIRVLDNPVSRTPAVQAAPVNGSAPQVIAG